MKKFLKFEADWCSQCKAMDSILKGSDLPIEHINVDDEDNELLVEQFKIRSMPTLVLVDEHDKELKRFVGITTVDKLKEAFENA